MSNSFYDRPEFAKRVLSEKIRKDNPKLTDFEPELLAQESMDMLHRGKPSGMAEAQLQSTLDYAAKSDGMNEEEKRELLVTVSAAATLLDSFIQHHPNATEEEARQALQL